MTADVSRAARLEAERQAEVEVLRDALARHLAAITRDLARGVTVILTPTSGLGRLLVEASDRLADLGEE